MQIERNMGIGIVGCGMIAEFHAQAINAIRYAHLSCVFSRHQENANRLAAKYQCKAYSDYESFLQHSDLDIITIATPSGAHLEPAIAAADAGKHVICEKPLEVTLERIDAMITACKKNGVILAGIHPRRFLASVTEFKKAVEAGRLGQIAMVDAYIKWHRSQEYYDSGAWRGTWQLDGGGALMNQSIHTIDLLYYLAGDIRSLCAFAKRQIHERIEVEDIAVAILEFENGAIGVIEGSTNCYSTTGHGAEVHICGSDGSVFMQDDKLKVWDFKHKLAKDHDIIKKYGQQVLDANIGLGAADPREIDFTGHKRVFEDALRAINLGDKPLVNGHEGRKSVEIILAIYQSALNGGSKVQLPLSASPKLFDPTLMKT